MSTRQTYVDGVLREQWDDPSRTYSEWDQSGTPTSSRPYTPEEDAAADAGEQAAAETANAAEVDSDLDAALAELQIIIDTDNSVINDNPAGEIKDIARVVKKVIRKLNERYEGTE